jgi:hypothetical protein
MTCTSRSRAGQPPPIVLAAGQAPAPVAAHGDLVGIWPQLRLQTGEIHLAPGDLIVAYSDGATDFSPESTEPLERFLLGADTDSADAAIEARAIAGRPTPRDDIAVVAIQFHGSAADRSRRHDPPGRGGETLGSRDQRRCVEQASGLVQAGVLHG